MNTEIFDMIKYQDIAACFRLPFDGDMNDLSQLEYMTRLFRAFSELPKGLVEEFVRERLPSVRVDWKAGGRFREYRYDRKTKTVLSRDEMRFWADDGLTPSSFLYNIALISRNSGVSLDGRTAETLRKMGAIG